MRIAFLAAIAALAAAPALAVQGHGDLRGGVSVGMNVKELPETGYKEFSCLAPKGKALNGFVDFAACEAGADHLHELKVEIDEPGQDDTLVAGHPVDLTLGFGDDGRLARIVILTKRKGPLFVRKKAFLLGVQAKARYGDQGWECQESPLAADEEALGPTSVKEHCVKSDGDRRITVDRALYRKTGSDAKAFVSESRVTIDWAKS